MISFRVRAFVFGLVGWLSAGMASGGTPQGVVYVVVSGQAVVVHLESGRLLKRLDFFDFLQHGEHAQVEGNQLTVIGRRRGLSKPSCVRIDPRLMRIRAFTDFPGEIPEYCSGRCVFPAKPANVKVSRQRREANSTRSGLRLVVERPNARDVELSVDQHPQASPFEDLDSWTMTQDRKKLVVLSTGGFKYQCYLRIYDYPSLRRRATVPILRLRDHVPIGLFVFQDNPDTDRHRRATRRRLVDKAIGASVRATASAPRSSGRASALARGPSLVRRGSQMVSQIRSY